MRLPGDRWIWIAFGAAIAVGALALVLLYAPHGLWKLALFASALTVAIVIGLNPKVRLLVLGTSSVFAGLSGLAFSVFFDFSIQLPDGSTGKVGVEAGTPIEGWIYLMLVVSGLIAVGVHTVFERQDAKDDKSNDEASDDRLIFVAQSDRVRERGSRNESEPISFLIMLSITKPFSAQARIVRADIPDALQSEVLVSAGNGVFADNLVTKKNGCEARIDVSFPARMATQMPFTRSVTLIDDRAQKSRSIDIQFEA